LSTADLIIASSFIVLFLGMDNNQQPL